MAILTYILAYQIYLATLSPLDTEFIIVLSFLAWAAVFFAVWMGYVTESTHRTLFVQEKTILEQRDAIQMEQEKSEKLLLNILPASIAKRLKEKESVIADRFEDVSVLFADLVGFTVLSNNVSPEELVTMLNKVFCSFDDLFPENC